MGYINYIERKPTIMTNNVLARPTAAQVQAETARQDRRAAAKARRQDDYRNDAGFINIYAA